MSASEEAAKLLASMTRGEKARLLQIVARDLGDAFPGIDSNPRASAEVSLASSALGFLSGYLEQARRLGVSETESLRSYPTLRAEDLANAWAYVRAHRNRRAGKRK